MSDDIVVVHDDRPTVIVREDTTQVVVAPSAAPVVTSTLQGPAGPPGPQGPSGGAYVHTQAVPAAVWTVNHGLGFPPNVTVVDSTGRVVEGDVEYPDASTVRLTFNGAFSGAAYLS